MKQMYNLILACLLIVTLSACGKRTETDSSADKVSGRYVQTESAETTEQAEQEPSAVSETAQTEEFLGSESASMPYDGIYPEHPRY
ncbi:MAG: hypothetical protein NC548_64725 [Lachnospiraceae bacterium]|nr:hypothetical protein [Lachnospiraceae bacterium]